MATKKKPFVIITRSAAEGRLIEVIEGHVKNRQGLKRWIRALKFEHPGENVRGYFGRFDWRK